MAKLNTLSCHQDMKRARYRGGPSTIMDPIEFEGYTIRVLKHGNTGHILYYAPRVEDLEPQWTMDLETAKKGVLKWKKCGGSVQELSTLESTTA